MEIEGEKRGSFDALPEPSSALDGVVGDGGEGLQRVHVSDAATSLAPEQRGYRASHGAL